METKAGLELSFSKDETQAFCSEWQQLWNEANRGMLLFQIESTVRGMKAVGTINYD